MFKVFKVFLFKFKFFLTKVKYILVTRTR